VRPSGVREEGSIVGSLVDGAANILRAAQVQAAAGFKKGGGEGIYGDGNTLDEIVAELREELYLMSHLHHPHILQFLGGPRKRNAQPRNATQRNATPRAATQRAAQPQPQPRTANHSHATRARPQRVAGCAMAGDALDPARSHDLARSLRCALSLRSRALVRSPRRSVARAAVTKGPHSPAIVMELASSTLAQLFKDSARLSLADSLASSIHVARAMSYLHGHMPHAIIHRDLKPSNVLRTASGAQRLHLREEEAARGEGRRGQGWGRAGGAARMWRVRARWQAWRAVRRAGREGDTGSAGARLRSSDLT
jgi:serine/threonine protein kinase